MDLCATSYTVLTPEMGVQTLATGVFGPLPPGTAGLLLGCSSASLEEMLIHPGVIDSDYTGEIKILASAPNKIIVINAGQRIAQLLLVSLVIQGKTINRDRQERGFGSSDAYWVQNVTEARPELELRIDGKLFRGVLDTGADISVISEKYWLTTWPKQIAISTLQGIGQTTNPEQSSSLLTWRDKDGHTGQFKPYILPHLPVNLWGRDILSKMGVYLYSPSPTVTELMLDQGLLPNEGLGK